VAVVELFNTPTVSAFADIVLPAAMFPERDGLQSVLLTDRIQTMNRAVAPPGECKPDLEICRLLGKRLTPEAWPWDSVDEIYDELLKPVGMTFKQLREEGPLHTAFEYRKHEKGLLRPDGIPGFNTPTGKIEIYSTVLEKFGSDPLPGYKEPEPGPRKAPELFREYPLILTTGGRTSFFFNSEHRQVGAGLRELCPDPLVEIHPDTAGALAISDGDWVWIENHHGRCRQRAKLTPTLRPEVVHAQHSWWFPERDMAEPCLGGAWESNINLLLPPGLQGESGFGYPFKVNICKVYKEEKNGRL
jgi:anaerobic selenocysteine-containing dehydrogenase